MKRLARRAVKTPRWSGSALQWEAFWREWKVFWRLKSHFYSADAKKYVFIECLPERYQEHMKSYITKQGWEHPDIVQFLREKVKVLAPD